MPWIILLFFCWMVRIATGCNLLHTYSIEVPKYVGESVLLPCSCADLQAKPQNVRWWKNTRQQIYPFKSHLDRIHMFNQDSPGNLSLLISDLTKEDEGNYRCEGSASYRDITLRVKGCSLMEKDTRFEIVKSSGESVLLPCSCSPLHVKPERVIWDFYRQRGSETGLTIEVPSTSGPYRGRVQMFNHHSPGNASLLISDLTEEDQGLYRCHLKEEVRRINLLIQASTSTPKAPPKTQTPIAEEKDIVSNKGTETPLYIFILVAVLLLLLLLGGVIFLYMRHKGQKGEITKSGQMREDEQKDDTRVYCTVQETRDDMFTQAENQYGISWKMTCCFL
ncbi:junctional adhesion molecule-like isoform X2 [Alosa pseudoharengus]|uniref:junctional adhesion molecule-like isoform X2 n=1 Tax=Alosa pseudoharengus TaxID=34774 RepID=UPI003F8BF496